VRQRRTKNDGRPVVHAVRDSCPGRNHSASLPRSRMGAGQHIRRSAMTTKRPRSAHTRPPVFCTLHVSVCTFHFALIVRAPLCPPFPASPRLVRTWVRHSCRTFPNAGPTLPSDIP
jgi:hypothetical protein